MYFLVDSKTKVIFGWSGKSGCSHIKKIYWYLQNNILDNPIHIPSKERDKLPIDIDEYITILIVRNPYERLVSGFFDKYKPTGEFRKKWPEETLCFSKFIDTLIKPDWKKIERHHFCPQTEDDFNNSILCE